MPKTKKGFPCTLNFGATLKMKQNLVAVGYLTGQGGEIASPARNFIDRAWDDWYRGLSDKERKAFDSILENVKIEVTK